MPAYAGHTRKKLEAIFTEQHGEFLADLEKLRNKIIQNVPDPADRKTLLGQLADDESFEYFAENGSAEWHAFADKLVNDLPSSRQ
jgi:siroheme synthase (precorrin-2 oxidase/ferrochelatase)